MSQNPRFRLLGRDVTLSDLELLSTLGVGTFGRVRLCRLRGDTQVFALKILKKSVILRLKQVDHIKDEKKVLELLNSPCFPRLHASFQSSTCLYLLVEYVLGGELFKRLRSAQTFPNDVALFYATEVVVAFETLHRQSIAFRDLKPENILIDRYGHIKLVDFGFAKVVRDKTFTLCGTPEYLAPETIEHRGHDVNVDWWALGILVFEMLVGHPPFFDDNPYMLYQKIVACELRIPETVHRHAASFISALVVPDVKQRLGYRGDAEAVKGHRWFRGVDFDLVAQRDIPAPWMPEVESEDDVSNFDQYPDSSPPEQPRLPAGADPFANF